VFDRNRHAVTATNGANYVARYNTVTNTSLESQAFDAHGYTASWPRGAKSVEIYNNTITNSVKTWAGAGIRGGGGVICGKKGRGVPHGVVLSLEDPPASHPLGTYPALDQIGNPNDLYVWNNTNSSGDSIYLNSTSNYRGISYWIKLNRDYFTTARSGYKPY